MAKSKEKLLTDLAAREGWPEYQLAACLRQAEDLPRVLATLARVTAPATMERSVLVARLTKLLEQYNEIPDPGGDEGE